MDNLPDLLRRAADVAEVLEREAWGEPIRIWPFHDAPEELKRLSDNGGDEDWLAFVPQWIWDREGGWIPFLDVGHFGVAHVNKYVVPGGVVLIGCHA